MTRHEQTDLDQNVATLQSTLFAGVETDIVETIVTKSTTRVYEAGEFVNHATGPSDAFFIIQKGSARAFHRSSDGLEVESRLLRVGSAVGVAECLLGLAYMEGVQTLERTTVLRVPHDLLVDALDASPALTRVLLCDVSVRLCTALNSERMLAFHRIETRLANFLTNYLEQYGLPAPAGIRIRIPLSQDDLANGLGVTRRSIARTMKIWMSAGIIEKQGRHFVILDRERLVRHGDSEALSLRRQINVRWARPRTRAVAYG